MRLFRASLILLGAAVFATPAFPQARMCLHTGLEVPAERERREEALAAARLINNAMTARALPNQKPSYPAWEELAGAPIPALPGLGSAMGELARKMRWGSPEPLPGWRIRHVADEDGYAFSLTDIRDPCGFAYFSNETGTVVEGYPVGGARRPGIVPIT